MLRLPACTTWVRMWRRMATSACAHAPLLYSTTDTPRRASFSTASRVAFSYPAMPEFTCATAWATTSRYARCTLAGIFRLSRLITS